MKNNQESQLQFLRVLAFFNVYALHADHWNIFNYPSFFGAVSAVNFFFMLSGFLTGYSFTDSKSEFRCKEYFSYMKRKISRFYPLYFLVTVYAISSSPIPHAFAAGNFEELTASIIQLIKHLLCIQSWFPEGFFSFCGPAWFSSTLLFLAALNLPFFLLLRRVNHAKRKNLLLSLISIGFFASTFPYSYLTQNFPLQFAHYIIPVSRVGIYLGSMSMGLLIRPIVLAVRKDTRHTRLFTLLEAGALVFWFISLRFPVSSWTIWNAAWILPNVLVLAAFIFCKGKLSAFFSLKPLVAMGNVSMECYMVHSLIISSYSNYNGFDTTNALGCLFSFFLCFVLTFLVAFALNQHQRMRA